ncbi:polycystic kidney disease protein 1-like 2 [Plakobranchus ocellatus]|uniref:Polycystic kidney disease protein 1-like 2 n=1 Tax=Plakobranchus ocellatus TaxID=259542 RepID=A0AAV4BCA9_9GAST|nr:polycystic kidney disease protein 1-like 2 [Plakobranchus ocellatus]
MLIHLLICARRRIVSRPTLGFGTFVEMLELGLGILATVIYCLKIKETIRLSNSVHKNPSQFVDFGLVFLYHEIYSAAVSTALFLAILRLLGPLGVNSHLYILKETLFQTRGAMACLGIGYFSYLLAFATFFYLFDGPYNYLVRSVYSACTSLFTLAIGMAHTSGIIQEVGDTWRVFIQRIMYCLFSSISTVLLINFAISTLNVTLGSTKLAEIQSERKETQKSSQRQRRRGDATDLDGEGNGQKGRDGIDRELGIYIMEKLSSLFSGCRRSEKRGEGGERNSREEKREKEGELAWFENIKRL